MGQYYKCLKCKTIMQFKGDTSANCEVYKCPYCEYEIEVIWDID